MNAGLTHEITDRTVISSALRDFGARRLELRTFRSCQTRIPDTHTRDRLGISRTADHKVERKDAVFSIARVAWLVLALQSGNVNNLRAGCEDRMHQPQRAMQDAYKHVSPVYVWPTMG